MKIVILLVLSCLIICGCASSRSAGRYGDGTVYDGIGDVKTLRRFCIRKLDIDEEYKALITSAKIQSIVPELIRARGRDDDIPVDIVVRVGDSEISGQWSMLFACLCGIVPSWTTTEFGAVVEVYFGDDAKALSRTECCFEQNFKMSIFSPLGCIPYPPKDGFQENEMKSGLFQAISPEVFSLTISKCVALQLKKYVEEKLTIPDVVFE